MLRERLPPTALASWAALQNVEFDGVHIQHLDDLRGYRAIAQHTGLVDKGHALMTVPADLVLSADTVGNWAKTDQHLRQLLSAVGELAQVPLIVTFSTT